MKRSSLVCTAIAMAMTCHVISTGIAFAAPQDGTRVSGTVAPSHSTNELPAQYIITLSEYRLKDHDFSELTAAKIAGAIKAENATPVETIVLSATSGAESMVSFGRAVTVTVGHTTTRQGNKLRKTQKIDLGTSLRVTPTAVGKRVEAIVLFNSSRHAGVGTDDSPPNIIATKIETKQLLDLDNPTLIGATTAGETSFVFLTVTQR